MTKPKSTNALQAVLDRQAREEVPASSPIFVATPPSPPRQARDSERSRSYRPVRDGKRFIGGHFDPKVAKQLKLLAAEEESTLQQLMEEALDLLFLKKGKGRIVRTDS